MTFPALVRLEQRSGVWVVVWPDEATRNATDVEVELWERLLEACDNSRGDGS